PITQYVAYDSKTGTSSTGGPALFAHSRTNFDADATWSKLMPLGLTFGYSRNNAGYDERIFGSTGENAFRVIGDYVTSSMVSFRAQYEGSSRNGADFDEAVLTQIGEQPGMRHFDLADRNRNPFKGQVDVTPDDNCTFSA